MHASECRSYPNDAVGCAAHGLVDCLCDVRPIEGGVPIRSIPFEARLVELGLNRLAFVAWAEEITALQEGRGLQLVAEA